MNKGALKIGIQGGMGSTNERALKDFMLRFNWEEEQVETVYLIRSEPVIKAVIAGDVDYGVFAFRSKSLLVKETIDALQKFDCLSIEIVDEVALQLDHALFYRGSLNPQKPLKIYSHLQALKVHEHWLRSHFFEYDIEFCEEIDTAESVKLLSEGRYEPNSLAIASARCEKLFDCEVLIKDLPSNLDYITKFWLVKKNPFNQNS